MPLYGKAHATIRQAAYLSPGQRIADIEKPGKTEIGIWVAGFVAGLLPISRILAMDSQFGNEISDLALETAAWPAMVGRMLVRVLLAVKEAPARRRLKRLLVDHDVQVEALSGRALVWEDFTRRNADLVVVGESLVPDDAEPAIEEVRASPYAAAVVVMVAYDDLVRANTLRAAGAAAVLCYDLDDDVLDRSLDTVIDERRQFLEKSVVARRLSARPQLADFVSSSLAMQQLVRVAHRVSASDIPLLILGETGVGKERLTRAIHEASPRSAGPFIAVNCGAIPENLFESELFGHEEGAFTGATRARRGCFELAHRGTIFLDEIGELPAHLQVKLLHVLQDYAFTPVGAEHAVQVDVRITAATNRDLDEEVREGRFRQDLFYRLSVIKLELPPLRDRKEDLAELTESFIREIGSRIGHRVEGIEPKAMEALQQYGWPGNIRELINVLERAILLTDNNRLEIKDLPHELQNPHARTVSLSTDSIPDEWLERPMKAIRNQVVDHYERAYLTRLLESTQGRINLTAERAGIEPRSLNGKMKKYGLRKEDFKHAGR